jgi:hypothetical protein
MKQHFAMAFGAVLLATSIAQAAPVLSSTQTINLAPATVNNDGGGGIGAQVFSIAIKAPSLRGVDRTSLTLTTNLTLTSAYNITLTNLFLYGDLSNFVGVEWLPSSGVSSGGIGLFTTTTTALPFGDMFLTTGSTSDPFNVSFTFAIDPSVNFKTDDLFQLNITANGPDLSGGPLRAFLDTLVRIDGKAAAVPEPAAFALLGLGALALVASHRRG